jgi:Prealbumin-like fold domain
MTAVKRRLGPRRKSITLGVTLALMAAALVLVLPATASHPEVSLAGSNFEIDTDANLVVDDAGSLDWANVSEVRKDDKPTGQTDDSFGQGTKEDTPVPTIVDGSIPNNKSDLLNFGVYQETTAAGRNFMHLFWHRVQEPNGTTNMDFEFNQSSTLSSNGVTPVRTAGDLLIQYDLSQGGTSPTLWLSRWVATGPKSLCNTANSTPCWGVRVNLTSAGIATGSINSSAIAAADADGLGGVSARTFGEASVDLDAILSGGGATGCVAFGSGYLKSRASDSFPAELKDFIAPAPVNINLCGSVKIIKTDDAGAPLAGAEFTLYKDNAPIGGSRGAEDTITTLKCTTAANGECTISNVLAGEYWVVETVVPPGHEGVGDQHVTVVANQTVTVGPLVNPRQVGAIEVTKLRKHAAAGSGDHPHAGVSFTVNGETKQTDANGKACFDGLLFGDYTVHETTPAGYKGEADKTVTVDNKASCSDATYVGETVTFHNTPLSDITVSFSSQIAGGTAAQISCTGLTATPPDGTPGAFDDTSEAFKDLEPGTYNCTVVVDP